MIFQLFRRVPETDSIAALYGIIVAQARAPAFYQDYGVPDTVDGRFEMVVLHTVLVLRRLDAERGPIREMGQRLFDLFCKDMDGSLREMGVGDLGVPREMRRIGEAFYGRQAAYTAALESNDRESLFAAVERDVFDGSGSVRAVQQLASYICEAARDLDAMDSKTLRRGEVIFPDPERVAVLVRAPAVAANQ
jgi:cytochrome b pre-mRNA-processing protein 3